MKRLRTGSSRTETQPLGTAAVTDAAFEVKKGEIFVVMGLSGSEPTELRGLRHDHMSMVFQHFGVRGAHRVEHRSR